MTAKYQAYHDTIDKVERDLGGAFKIARKALDLLSRGEVKEAIEEEPAPKRRPPPRKVKMEARILPETAESTRQLKK